MSTVTLQVTIERDGCCELHLAGEIDIATVDGLIGLGLFCLNQITVDRLVIGLGAVTFLDAAGLGAFVTLRNAGREVGKTVELAVVPPFVVRLLLCTGLATAFVTRSCPEPAPSVDPLGDLNTVVMASAAAPTAQLAAANNNGVTDPYEVDGLGGAA